MRNSEVPSQRQRNYQEDSIDINSEINDEMDKDVARYTMQSYLGSYVGSSNDEKKEAAVQKISNLPKGNFDELVGDIINEIHRRCEMAYDEEEKPMRDKLMRLKDEKFKNLVYDVLQVFNSRYISTSADLKDEITNLGKLISILKVEEESSDYIINETNDKLKVKLFIEYVKKFHNDKTVEYMENYIQDSINSDTNNNFEILFNYKILLQKLDKSKYRNLREYQIYKSNIRRIEQMNLEGKTKKDLIKKEYLNISELILNKQYHFEELCIKNNVNHLINLFTKYTNDEYVDKAAFISFQKDVAGLIHKIADKAYTIAHTNKDIIFSLREQVNRSLDPSLHHKYNKSIVEITSKIRELLENIKK